MGKIYNVQPVVDPSGVVIDSTLSRVSENPVQNKVITLALDDYQLQSLSSAITIAGVNKTNVEDALNALNDTKLESSDIGTAAVLDVAASGNAGANEVVKGDDTRLSDARTPVSHTHSTSEISDFPASMPASDVSAWAKAATKPSYNYSEIDNTPTLGTAAAKNVPTSGNASGTEVVMGDDTRLSDARNAADVSAWAKAATKPSYDYSEINNTPTLGTAAALNVAASGNASNSQVVKGDDSRLNDARTPVAHNHTVSEISDFPASMPASDVSAWAKAATKPSYTASEVGAIDLTTKGAANGVAELDSNGKVPASQLPSFVDDVVDGYYHNGKFYEDVSYTVEITGESGKVYIAKDTNITYRWSGTAFVPIGSDLALGETSSTAYRGDRGKEAYDHSQSAHARTDATAVASSSINGNITINGTETTVYTHPGSGTNPHGTTKSDLGLDNVGNFKAVSTEASQGLSTIEKGNARANIGAGTSNFDGKYNSLSGTPTLGTAAALNVASSGNASSSQVVKGDDTRLSDARKASDVSAWAKAATKPSYNYSEINNTPTLGTAAALNVASSGNAGSNQVVKGNDSRLTDARTPVSHTHTKSEISDFPTSMPASDVSAWAKAATKPSYDYSEINNTPTLGTAAALNVAASGNASSSQVVKGNDTRLSDARNTPYALKIVDGNGTINYFKGSIEKTYRKNNVLVDIPSTGWSSTTDSSGYYTNTVSLGLGYNTYDGVDVKPIGSTRNTRPTPEEGAAYNLVDEFHMDDGYNVTSITAKAKTKPTITFYILVQGDYIG